MKVVFDEIDHFHPNFDESVPNHPVFHGLGSVADSTERLKTVGARIPSWEALAGGVRPGTRRLKDREPNEPHHAWLAESVFHESQHPSQRRSGVATVVTVRAGISPIPKWSDGVRPVHNIPSG